MVLSFSEKKSLDKELLASYCSNMFTHVVTVTDISFVTLRFILQYVVESPLIQWIGFCLPATWNTGEYYEEIELIRRRYLFKHMGEQYVQF